MLSTWETMTVQELIENGEAELRTGPFGTQLHASDYASSGTPVINVRNIGFGNIREESLEFIEEETVQRLSSHLLAPGDIVFGRKGAVERHAYIQRRHVHWFQGSDCLRLRIKSERIIPRFVSYYFLTERHKQWMMNQCSHGATMASLNQAVVSRIPLNIPPHDTQHKIVTILSAYDDLIENNTRRIAILEDMAQAIYREWFVHFRFPGHEGVRMVESELGPVPEGWEVRCVGDFGEVITGKTPSKKVSEYYGDYMPFIKTPSMHGNIFCIETEEYLSQLGAASQENKTLPPDTLCVSCIGSPGIVSLTTVPSQTNQQINSIILNDLSEREFLYFALLGLRETILQYAATGATMANLSKGKFTALQVLRPAKAIVGKFHQVAFLMFEQIKNLQYKNLNLRQTRDLLLPRLVSGELDVSELEVDIGGLGI